MTKASGHVHETDVVIIGAGVAGCAAAVGLSRQGFRVALLDRSASPQSRFCGEFVSGEALAPLDRLGVADCLADLDANPVRQLELHPIHGRCLRMPLAAGSFALSRHTLDAMLLQRALREGARLFSGMQVTAVSGRAGHGYRVEALAQGDRVQAFSARVVVGAYGKRSSVDRLLSRPFLTVNSGWIGVRQHYYGIDRGDAAALYLFPGGYCGAVTVENGVTTLALLARQAVLNECGGRPERLIDRARLFNLGLRKWLDDAWPIPGSLMAISRISFAPKRPVVEGVFMVGDSAAVAPPFLGIGITSALGAAQACAEAVGGWLGGSLQIEQARWQYERWWRHGNRVRQLSRPASWLLCHPLVGNTATWLLNGVPSVGRAIYRASRVIEPPNSLRPMPSGVPADLVKRLPLQAGSETGQTAR